MGEEAKKNIEQMGRALDVLPDDKKQYLIGYADGVLAMADRQEKTDIGQPGT